MENEKQNVATGQPDVPRKARKIGNMTYLVGVHFNEDSKMDVGDKLKRVLLHDLEQKKG
ncbi:transposon-encoded TnpW family protein [Clostridium butyricum]|uniref:transposon-encoded TnpW family protein n=1 Tax=Clostridium butyricum TaxID=1492 RepID=UPI000A0FB190|nr:transposon-encoded TnpW family protein [Clostridium butyricum]